MIQELLFNWINLLAASRNVKKRDYSNPSAYVSKLMQLSMKDSHLCSGPSEDQLKGVRGNTFVITICPYCYGRGATRMQG